MNLSIIGMVEHRRVHGTRYLRGVVDRSLVAYTSATVIAAHAASEACSSASYESNLGSLARRGTQPRWRTTSLFHWWRRVSAIGRKPE